MKSLIIVLMFLCSFVVMAQSSFISVNYENDANLYKNEDSIFTGEKSSDITKVKIYIDKWPIGDAIISGDTYTLTYKINTSGNNRVLRVIGLNDSDTVLQETQRTINVTPKYDTKYFNQYILKAIDYLDANYAKLGYDSAVLTHDIDFGEYGTIKASKKPYSMCVSAQLEIILTAYEIYFQETGDDSVYTYLPKNSYEKLGATNIKGHIWVNSKYNAHGTADALINFGMGERVPFEKLTPGSFVNINRTTGTGHAVAFLGFIDKQGNILDEYSDKVIGFKYYSSQGVKQAPGSGLDYRYAIFSQFGCPSMPYKRDCNVRFSSKQTVLNTGNMLHPALWQRNKTFIQTLADKNLADSVFDEKYFDGRTTDD